MFVILPASLANVSISLSLSVFCCTEMVPSNLGEEMSTKVTLPPEWEDDERMNFLFSDFKENRDVNTKDWDSKIDFWTSLMHY